MEMNDSEIIALARKLVSARCEKDTHQGAFRKCIIDPNHNFVIKFASASRDGKKSGTRQCNREVDNYILAKLNGLEKYFAKYYGNFVFRKKTYFVFEYIGHVGEGHLHLEETHVSSKLKRFLRDNNIGDMHPGNYGKRGRQYVITDYASCYYSDWVH